MRKSFAKILVCMLSAMLLAGCGGNTDSSLKDKQENVEAEASQEETEEDNPDEEKPEKESEKESGSDGKSLAQRMTGKYSYHYSDEDGNDEFYIMDVVSFGDNLYAFCGQAMPDDSEDIEAYTFWASEFIPYNADEMTGTDGDTATVNELRFSIMSNAGKYWDAGHKGTITLTDDGLVFEGFDNEGFLVPDNDDSRLFLKDDRVEDAFGYLKDDDRGVPEELQGLWVHSDKDEDLYIEFLNSNMYIYRKDPDKEVFYAAGGCDFHDGAFDFTGNQIETGGMPFEFSGEYKVDEKKLTLEIQGSDAPEFLSDSEDFRRVSESGVHVTTMDEVEFTADSFGMFGGNQHYDELASQDYYGVFVSSAKSPADCTPAINKLEDAGFVRSLRGRS